VKNVGNSSRGRSRGVPKIFRAPVHCAAIFAIAQLSCRYTDERKVTNSKVQKHFKDVTVQSTLTRYFKDVTVQSTLTRYTLPQSHYARGKWKSWKNIALGSWCLKMTVVLFNLLQNANTICKTNITHKHNSTHIPYKMYRIKCNAIFTLCSSEKKSKSQYIGLTY